MSKTTRAPANLQTVRTFDPPVPTRDMSLRLGSTATRLDMTHVHKHHKYNKHIISPKYLEMVWTNTIIRKSRCIKTQRDNGYFVGWLARMCYDWNLPKALQERRVLLNYLSLTQTERSLVMACNCAGILVRLFGLIGIISAYNDITPCHRFPDASCIPDMSRKFNRIYQ